MFLYLVGRASPGALSGKPVLLLIPVGLGGFGYVVDHIPRLSVFSLSGLDTTSITIGGVTLGPTVLVALVAVSIVIVVVAAVATKKKHRRKHR